MHIRLALGWLPDLPDHRDHHYVAPPGLVFHMPPSVDLRPQCPPVLSQGMINSCTAQALANAHLFGQRKQGLPAPFLPSRLFIYWNERVKLHMQASDAGATIRGGIKAIAKLGACAETLWDYDSALVLKEPPEPCYTAALPHRALVYQRLPRDIWMLRACLAEGWPFVFGFTTYEEFHSPAVAASGVLPMPTPDEAAVGGHAVLAVGYDEATRTLLAMNSYGARWGQAGCFTIPWDYVLHEHLCRDFWTLRTVAG